MSPWSSSKCRTAAPEPPGEVSSGGASPALGSMHPVSDDNVSRKPLRGDDLRSRGCQAKPTKRRTRPRRLRGTDLLIGDTDWIGPFHHGDVWVELGFGCQLTTVDDLQAQLLEQGISAPIVALDSEVPQPMLKETHALRVRRSGFDLALRVDETPRVIRMMNVLRGYPAAEARAALEHLAAFLPEEGLLIEGSSCPEGSVLCAHLIRRRGRQPQRRALLFYTDFSQGFAPWMFRDRLPRDLRAHAGRGGPLFPMFQEWAAAWHIARSETKDPRRTFCSTARLLTRTNPYEWWTAHAKKGLLVWTPRAGVPG